MLSLIYQIWDLFANVLLNLIGEELLFISIACRGMRLNAYGKARLCFARVQHEWG